MAERARAQISHRLRALRVALRESPGIHDKQLRFRIGPGYAFDEQLTGWDRGEDAVYELTLAGDSGLIADNPVMELAAEPGTDIERKALVALRWIDRAYLTEDQLVAVLYRFFALEALLGRKSEGLKAHGLAFRQMVLSHAGDRVLRAPERHAVAI